MHPVLKPERIFYGIITRGPEARRLLFIQEILQKVLVTKSSLLVPVTPIFAKAASPYIPSLFPLIIEESQYSWNL